MDSRNYYGSSLAIQQVRKKRKQTCNGHDGCHRQSLTSLGFVAGLMSLLLIS